MRQFDQEKAEAAVKEMRAAEQLSRAAKSFKERLEAAIQNIRAFYDLGRNLTKQDHKGGYKKKTIDKEAKLLQINPDTARKARVFANPESGYTRGELVQLCQLIRKEQPITRAVNGMSKELSILQRTHVIRLLSVPRGKGRPALQEECVMKGWSTAELEREINKRYGTRKDGGRRRAIPSEMNGFLVQLEGMCEQWKRWEIELSRDSAELQEKHVLLTDVPDGSHKQISATNKQIGKLHRTIVQALKQAQPKRKIRTAFEENADD
jgi:hypothetical protein